MLLDYRSPEALASVCTDNLIKVVITEQDGNMPPGHMDWSYLPMAKGSPGGLAPSVPSFTPLLSGFFTRPQNSFPKGSAFVLAAVRILLPRSPLGVRLPLSPLLLPVPPLPPHVPCLR